MGLPRSDERGNVTKHIKGEKKSGRDSKGEGNFLKEKEKGLPQKKAI